MSVRNVLLGTVLAVSFTGAAHASFIATGTPFTINTTNATTTGTSNVTFQPGNTQAISGGSVNVLIQDIPEAGGQEWLLYSFTSTGANISGNVLATWEIQIQGLATTQPVSVNHFFLGWGTGGALSNPISDSGVNLPIETNPVTGKGQVFGESVTGVIESVLDGAGQAGIFTDLMGINYGLNPSIVNFFQIGELIGPAPIPEPGGMLVLIGGILGLIGTRRYLKS